MTWTRVRERLEQAGFRRLRRWLSIIVAVVMAGLITHGHYAGSGDAIHYMVIAQSIAFDRDIDLGNNYRTPGNIIQDPASAHARPGANGVLRPVHDIGMPLLAAPAYALAYQLAELTDRLPESLRRRAKLSPFIALRQLISLMMIAVTVWLARLFFAASARVTGALVPAFLSALVVAISPPILTHGYVFMTEIPTAVVALAAFSRLDDLRGERPLARGALAGLLTGLLMLIHVRNAGLVIALVALAAWRVRGEWRRGAGFAGAVAVMAAAKIAINLQFWGTAMTTPHEHFGDWPGIAAFVAESALRLAGLLFDARHGLLLIAPIFLLAPAAWLLLRKRDRQISAELALMTLMYLALVINPVTNIHGWRGGWSPAARFLVPVIPFLAMALPLLFAGLVQRRVLALVIALQLVIDAVVWSRPMASWSEGPGPAAWLQMLVGRDAAASLPTWERFTVPLALVLGVALAVWLMLTWLLARLREDRTAPRDPHELSRTSVS